MSCYRKIFAPHASPLPGGRDRIGVPGGRDRRGPPGGRDQVGPAPGGRDRLGRPLRFTSTGQLELVPIPAQGPPPFGPQGFPVALEAQPLGPDIVRQTPPAETQPELITPPAETQPELIPLFVAIVDVPGRFGVNTRTAPNVNAPLASANDARHGDRVLVFRTGITEEGCPRCDWWLIQTPGGSIGWAQALGPSGGPNLRGL